MPLITVLIWLLAAQRNPPDTPTPLLDTEGLRGWNAERVDPSCVRNQSATIVVAPCAGWVRTDTTIFGDYSISFEARGAAGARALVGVLGVDDQRRRPELALAIPLFAPFAGTLSAARIEVLPVSEAALTQAIKPGDAWQSYAVSRNRTGVHSMVNGTEVLSVGPVRASDGWIGFRSDGGELEVRNIRLRRPKLLPWSANTPGVHAGEMIDGAYLPGKNVILPKIVREVKPAYTREALAAKIEGAVLLECVVEPDGTVDRVKIVRSLDDRFGLDQEAIKAARAWRFMPGMRDGRPVPVVVSLELTFSIRK